MVAFRKVPVRYVVLAPHGADWFASYAGDPWTDAWETQPGSLALVRDALTFDLLRGLPVVREPVTNEPMKGAA